MNGFACVFQSIGGIPHTNVALILCYPACCMTLDDILPQPTHLTAVAWPVSEHSDTLVSSLFWLPPAACWSWSVFQPWCVSMCAMLNRLQLCVTHIPFATPKSMPLQAKTLRSLSEAPHTHTQFLYFSYCIIYVT